MGVRVSSRGRVEPFYAMELLKLANQKRQTGMDVISLCLGQPAAGAPAVVRRAAIDALASGSPLGYTDANGIRRFVRRSAPTTRPVQCRVDPARYW